MENVLEVLCRGNNKVIRSSSDVMTITRTTAKNTATASGMIAAIRLGRRALQNDYFCNKKADWLMSNLAVIHNIMTLSVFLNVAYNAIHNANL